MKQIKTPIEEQEKAMIDCKIVHIGDQYWRLSKQKVNSNGMILITNSNEELWELWERAKFTQWLTICSTTNVLIGMFTHTTKVRIDLQKLSEVTSNLAAEYAKIGHKETFAGRSAFCAWNNIARFGERIAGLNPKDMIDCLDRNETHATINITGTAKGATARVYYTPSVTSLAKPFRQCVVPIKEGNTFLFFDLKAAEFYLFCVFAQEESAIASYHRGEDIYMNYAPLFPTGTERKVIKKVMIANMYDTTAYRVGIDVGISESRAQMLLDNIARKVPRMTAMKQTIILNARRKRGYFAPTGLDQTNLMKVADIEPPKNPAKLEFGQDSTGFKYRLALSAYVQSALGYWMQNALLKVEAKTSGTLLSVFDSMLIELQPHRVDAAKKFMASLVFPFKVDTYTTADNFYLAQEGHDYEMSENE